MFWPISFYNTKKASEVSPTNLMHGFVDFYLSAHLFVFFQEIQCFLSLDNTFEKIAGKFSKMKFTINVPNE